MSASSLSLPIFLRINFLISYLIVTDSQNTFDWHTQRALLNDKKAGAGCTSRAFKHPGRDVTAPDVWPSILTDYTYDSELDNADGVPLASRRSSMFPEGNHVPCTCTCTMNHVFTVLSDLLARIKSQKTLSLTVFFIKEKNIYNTSQYN